VACWTTTTARPALLRRRFNALPVKNISVGAARQFVFQIGGCTLDAAIAPSVILFRHPNNQSLDIFAGAGRPGPRLLWPSYFCAISLRCHANKVSRRGPKLKDKQSRPVDLYLKLASLGQLQAGPLSRCYSALEFTSTRRRLQVHVKTFRSSCFRSIGAYCPPYFGLVGFSCYFGHVSREHEPEFDFRKDPNEEEDRMNDENDEDEERNRQEKQDDEEDEDIYSDDMHATSA
jgi:hypothetical protein